MRRLTLLLLVASLGVAGCGGGETASPTPDTVEGKVSKGGTAAKGNPGNGKKLFASNGCGNCHIYAPAGSTSTVGPNLDKLQDLAQKANRGTTEEFTKESITDPGEFVEKGYSNVMPPFKLEDQDLADLVAFLTAA